MYKNGKVNTKPARSVRKKISKSKGTSWSFLVSATRAPAYLWRRYMSCHVWCETQSRGGFRQPNYEAPTLPCLPSRDYDEAALQALVESGSWRACMVGMCVYFILLLVTNTSLIATTTSPLKTHHTHSPTQTLRYTVHFETVANKPSCVLHHGVEHFPSLNGTFLTRFSSKIWYDFSF